MEKTLATKKNSQDGAGKWTQKIVNLQEEHPRYDRDAVAKEIHGEFRLAWMIDTPPCSVTVLSTLVRKHLYSPDGGGGTGRGQG